MSFLIALLSCWAYASEVVVQSPTSSDVEYRAYMAAHADCVTPTEALNRLRPSSAAKEKLVNDFADAQKAFLGTDADFARAKLEALISQIPSEDWSPADRQVFFKSAMRRAQLGLNDSDTDSWLRVALSIGYEINPDRTLFPPPLIQRWQQLKQKTQLRTVQVNGLGGDWTQVMINGATCTATSCPAFPDTGTPVRITWFSDKWQPYTVTTPLSHFSQENPARRAWVAGECRSPLFDRAANVFHDRQPFFGLDCEKAQVTGANLNLNRMGRAADLNMFAPPKKERPLYKSPWLWAGVGAAIAVVIATSQKSKDKKDPSTSYGY